MSDANSLIMGSSIPSCGFLDIGAEHKGTITALDVMQARKFGKPNELDFWEDGQPKMQAVVTMQTEENDPEIENDNGMRRLYVASPRMRSAIASAVKKAGATGLAVGGKLGVKFLREDPEGKNKQNLPKIYGAIYEAPPARVDEPEAYSEPDDMSGWDPDPF